MSFGCTAELDYKVHTKAVYNDPAVMEQVTGVLNDGGSCHLYTLEGAGFALASFAVMSLITAVIIVVTKKFWLLDFLLYGKQRRRNL